MLLERCKSLLGLDKISLSLGGTLTESLESPILLTAEPRNLWLKVMVNFFGTGLAIWKAEI
jgi:hypothetical protein